MALNRFQKKAKLLEVLGEEFERIEISRNCLLSDYRRLDEMEQDKRWNSETHEYDLIWEDEEETVPKMVNKYGSVDITYEELDDEKKAKYDALYEILKALEKLM